MYWSNREDLKCDIVRNTFSRDRFRQINRSIHLSENDKAPKKNSEKYDRMFKIRTFINLINIRFKKNMSESPNYSIDESMIKFKGRSSSKQYMPLKPIKRGFKMWSLCDSKTGYLYKFDIYCGKLNNDNDKRSESTKNIVLKLMNGFETSNVTVYFDNFYTSIPLAESLLDKSIALILIFL